MRSLFSKIREEFSNLDSVLNFLDRVEMDIIENVQKIMVSQSQQQGGQIMQMMGGGQNTQKLQDSSKNLILDQYRINVLVNHRDTDGAPVVYEDNANYKNLIGRVEYQSKMGALTTNFNLIKAGALHKANGGYLILDARQALLEPFAWEGLKRALKSGKLKIESLGESYNTISTVSLAPEPIHLNAKVVLFGERIFYYLLCQLDPDFKNLFKVEADFEDEVERNDNSYNNYAKLLAGLIREYNLMDFNKSAVAQVIEQSARMAGDNQKMSAELYALLSAIGKIPIKQSLSVTGSVNQHGKVQPIGGVNEKIEDFFDICRKRGLTGEQGILIPNTNEKNLMLRNDVITAVEEEKFHIFSIETIDEGMELLTGMKMGEPDEDGNYPKDTVNGKIIRQLNDLAEKRLKFTTSQNRHN